MTPVERHRKDTKLLITVAGLVVVGAAGLALIGGLVLNREPESDSARSTPAREATPSRAEAPAMPAVADATRPEATLASYETVPTGDVSAEAAAPVGFSIDPTENLVQGGLEAYGSRDFGRAAAYFRAENDARPQRAWTQFMLGLSLWKAGRTDEAAAAMEAAVELDPDSVKALVNLARIRNDGGDYEGALEAARAARAIAPEEPSALFLEGRSLFNLGRLDEALVSLAASVEIDPDNGYVRNLLGLALIRQGCADEAVETLERAAELAPQVAYVHNNLGMALELSGRASEAVVAYGRSVEIDPAQAKAAANLARLEPVAANGPASARPGSEQVVESAGAVAEIAAVEGGVVP
jgi:tetratricopeptide (TPR) repeat protein